MDTLHVAYYDEALGDLKYASHATGAWVSETVYATGDVGRAAICKIDSLGNAHLGCYDATNGDLLYFNNTSGSWLLTRVDEGGDDGIGTDDVGAYLDMALDAENDVHFAYYNSTTGDLKYATTRSLGTGTHDIPPP